MQFLTESKNEKARKACLLATRLLADSNFWFSIPDNILFDMSRNQVNLRVGKLELKDILLNSVTTVEVRTYWKMRNPFTGAIVVGHYNGGKTIFSNTNACPTIPHFVGNFIHELCHLADNFSASYIGHGNNNPKNKEKTAPYYMGSCAKKFAERYE